MGDHLAPVQSLAGHAEYEVLQEDIAFLVEEVARDMRRFGDDVRPLPADYATAESLLPTNWSFALVTMPCWIGRGLGVAEELRRRSMVAAYYLFHFVLGADRLVDHDAGAAQLGSHDPSSFTLSPTIASGLTLVHWLAIRQYHYLFQPSAPFWAALEEAHVAWGQSLRWEREPYQYLSLPLEGAMEREGKKCALLYVNCAAVVHGSNRFDCLQSIERATSEINMIMNLIDDAYDWITDLREGRHNSFVALAIAHKCIGRDSLNANNLLSAMLSTSLLDHYVHKVAVMTERVAKLLAPVASTLFEPFLDDLRDLPIQYRREFRDKISTYSRAVFDDTGETLVAVLRAEANTIKRVKIAEQSK